MYEVKCDGSFIKIPSPKVAEMAKAKIKWIEKYRANKIAKLIGSRRQEMIKPTWWDRLWNNVIPVPTDQEVIEDYRREAAIPYNWFDPLYNAEQEYSGNYYIAHRLLRATQHADEIYISTEDLQDIS